MTFPRRKFLTLAGGVAALPAASQFTWAQAYPARPVRVIVPFAPGGPADVLARMITQKLSIGLGQQFYVENQPGGHIARSSWRKRRLLESSSICRAGPGSWRPRFSGLSRQNCPKTITSPVVRVPSRKE